MKQSTIQQTNGKKMFGETKINKKLLKKFAFIAKKTRIDNECVREAEAMNYYVDRYDGSFVDGIAKNENDLILFLKNGKIIMRNAKIILKNSSKKISQIECVTILLSTEINYTRKDLYDFNLLFLNVAKDYRKTYWCLRVKCAAVE